jgi:murein DD-endopeptidase MepM/ murein hydrolase activator NlpD
MPDNKYLDEFPGVEGDEVPTGGSPGKVETKGERLKNNRILSMWEDLSQAGLGETVFRLGTHMFSLALVLIVVWAMRAFYLSAQEENQSSAHKAGALAASLPTAFPTATPPPLPPFINASFSFNQGIPRLLVMDTVAPTLPRGEITTYTVVEGDSVFGIAEKYGLKPETVLWGNYELLLDNPHRLKPGQVLNILPVDGVYHKWSAGEGLNGVTSYYGVTPEDIINYPGNNLSQASIGEYSNPNIAPGTMLVVPGGRREFISWSAPRISRDNPGVARLLGPGHCGTISHGAVGSGSFIWPANERRLSGYDYSPATNHRGLDIAGRLGDPLYASDSGVIVYAGWNNYGYGNVVVIDHGYGWQTLYAHMSYLAVGCGESVIQGTVIGSIGSTGNSSGPHLHFEMLHESYGKVNPWDFLK